MRPATIIVFLLTLGAGLFFVIRHQPQSSPVQNSEAPVLKTENSQLNTLLRSGSLPTRLAYARTIDNTFDIAAILPHLRQINPTQVPSPSTETDFVVINELFAVHRRKQIDSDKLRNTLTTVLQSADYHEVLRDYAAQHLLVLAGSDPTQTEHILPTIIATLRSPTIRQTNLPGTLFNALHHLRQEKAQLLAPHEHTLSQILLSFLKPNHGSPITSHQLPITSSVTLVQSLRHYGSSPASRAAALSILRPLIRDPKTPEALLISAAATLGHLGEKEDISLLKDLIARGTLASTAAHQSIQSLKNSVTQ